MRAGRPRGPRTLSETPGTAGKHRETSDPGPDHPGKLVDPCSLGLGPRSQGTAGRARASSDPGPSHPGLLVYTVGPRTGTQVTWDSWLTPQALGPDHKWPGRAGRPCGPSDPCPSCPAQLVDTAGPRSRACLPGQLVNPAGPQTRARVARDCWLTLRALGRGPKSPRSDGRPCRSWDMGRCPPRPLVDPTDPRNLT